MALETALPNTYFSKYSMVTFREDMGYNQAMLLGRAQDKAILNMIENKAIDLNLPIESIYEIIKKETYLILEGEQDTTD
jgi:kynurenine 3-monooxygenase